MIFICFILYYIKYIANSKMNKPKSAKSDTMIKQLGNLIILTGVYYYENKMFIEQKINCFVQSLII